MCDAIENSIKFLCIRCYRKYYVEYDIGTVEDFTSDIEYETIYHTTKCDR